MDARNERVGSSPRREVARPLALLLLAVAIGGCDAQAFGTSSPPGAGPEGAGTTHTPIHVDSIFPMDEEIRRFREGVPEVSGLTGGASSRDGLVDELVTALQRADTTAVTSLALNRAEFAWIYFPHTMYVAPPYELPPGLVWFQQQNRSSTGLTRLLRRYAGRTLHYEGFTCPDEGGEAFGEGRIWHGCTVFGTLPEGDRVEERIFGSILEWDGRYKLVSYSNEL